LECINKFFEENYDYLIGVAKGRVGEHAGDLVNDLYLEYLDNPDRFNEICERGELMKYICRTLAICSFSKTTRFYYKYKKDNTKISRYFPLVLLRNEDQYVHNEIDVNAAIDKVSCILQELPWFDREVFKIYHQHNHSLKTLSDVTKISKSTLHFSLQKTEDFFQDNSERIRGLYREIYRDNGTEETG